MIPAIDLSRAEERQRVLEQERQTCRDKLKTIEPEDQALKRLIRAGKLMREAVDKAPAELLASLGFRAGQDDEPPLVEVAPVAPFTPALDYPDSHPVEPPKREPNVRPIAAAAAIQTVVSEPIPVARMAAESSRPARPNSRKVTQLADEILECFRKVRLNAYASIEMDELCLNFGKTPKAIDAALADLKERKLIQPVRAERGHRTVKLLDRAVVAA